MFVGHFVNIVKHLNVNSYWEFETVDIYSNVSNEMIVKPNFGLRPVDNREVEEIMESLKNKNYSDYDEVPITVIEAIKTNRHNCRSSNKFFIYFKYFAGSIKTS